MAYVKRPGAVSPLRQALDVILGEGVLEELVRAERAKGVAWRRVALTVRDRTGVDVTHESLRSWFGEENGGRAA